MKWNTPIVIESVHGVIVDVVETLKSARKAVQEVGGFRTIKRRAYYVGPRNIKRYINFGG